MRHRLVLFSLVTACACGAPPQTPLPPASAAPPTAPWSGQPLRRADVPAVYYQQWSRAQNRESCQLLALTQLGQGVRAVPRAATFSGGWAVAYDLPELRSAFGLAGSSLSANDTIYTAWPYSRRWSDGSSAGYGPEGGTGPSQLAYLRIAGQACLYNVWSRLGKDHLELLFDGIRRVNVAAAP